MNRLTTSFFPLIALCGLLFLSGCSRNPVTGKRELMLMSESQEIRMGQQSDPSIVASYGLYQDPKLQKFITERGMKMAKISHRPKLPYEFKILDSPVVNAFAVPGGYIYFTRGIMAHFNNEAQFAGVLGHEIGHVTARHSASQYSKSMVAQVGFIAGMVVSPEFRQFAETAQQGLGLLFLKFGRDAERQSDELGVSYSTQVGYDATEMADFFKTLQRMQENAGAELPTFLSTHPDPADRYSDVRQMATQAKQSSSQTNFETNREGYLRMIEGIVYGEDPRQGYVQNEVFYHPELRFQFPVPSNWRLNNMPTQVQISPEDGKALIIFTLAQQQSLEAAAQQFVEETKLQVAGTDKGQVNGLPSIAVIGDQVNEESQQSIRILSYFIQYGNNIYRFHGLALKQDYAQYSSTFQRSMKGFAELTDRSKIDVVPERISIQAVKRTAKLSEAFRSFNMPGDRHEELAILNGMELTDVVQAGTLIKTVDRNASNQMTQDPSGNQGKTDQPIISPSGKNERALQPTKPKKSKTKKSKELEKNKNSEQDKLKLKFKPKKKEKEKEGNG